MKSLQMILLAGLAAAGVYFWSGERAAKAKKAAADAAAKKAAEEAARKTYGPPKPISAPLGGLDVMSFIAPVRKKGPVSPDIAKPVDPLYGLPADLRSQVQMSLDSGDPQDMYNYATDASLGVFPKYLSAVKLLRDTADAIKAKWSTPLGSASIPGSALGAAWNEIQDKYGYSWMNSYEFTSGTGMINWYPEAQIVADELYGRGFKQAANDMAHIFYNKKKLAPIDFYDKRYAVAGVAGSARTGYSKFYESMVPSWFRAR